MGATGKPCGSQIEPARAPNPSPRGANVELGRPTDGPSSDRPRRGGAAPARKVSPSRAVAAAAAATGAGRRGKANQGRRREGLMRIWREDDPNEAMKGRNGDRRLDTTRSGWGDSAAGEHAGARTEGRARECRHDDWAGPRSERPATPHERRRRPPPPRKAEPCPTGGRAGLSGRALRRDRETAAEPPSTLVRTRRLRGGGAPSRRSTGTPASRSAASARSAQRTREGAGEAAGGDAGHALTFICL